MQPINSRETKLVDAINFITIKWITWAKFSKEYRRKPPKYFEV